MSSSLPTLKFNHISFPSNDVEATAGFFERHLGCSGAAFGSSRLLHREGFDIVVEDAREHPVTWPRNFHVGFELPSAQDVVDLHARWQADGVEMATPVLAHVRGSRFFCRIPGGVLVEVNTRADAAEPFRQAFAARAAG